MRGDHKNKLKHQFPNIKENHTTATSTSRLEKHRFNCCGFFKAPLKRPKVRVRKR